MTVRPDKPSSCKAIRFMPDRIPPPCRRRGFTLIELLIVIAVIGILIGILVPVAYMVTVRTKEAKISFEVQQLEVAIEQYKNEFGTHPVDMSNPLLLAAHVNKIARRHAHAHIVNNQPSNVIPAWYTAPLPNPHFPVDSNVQVRSPQTMEPPEALVFFLSELSKNTQFPLGYRWDNINNQYVLVDGERWVFFSFDETRLTDYDNDGWFEYVQASGPRTAYMYFDSRSYLVPDFANNPNNIIANSVAVNRFGGQGVAQPYWQQWPVDNQGNAQTDWPTEFVNNQKFQIIVAGMDGKFSEAYQLRSPTNKHFWEPKKSYLLMRNDLDNFGNFADKRLDKDYEQ